MDAYQKTTLDNGLRVVTERLPYVKSVSVGIWVNIGSRDEQDAEAGLSHFIEHMIFKGTERRSTLQIAKEIDQVGGMANAFTAKEYTCFHARVMSGHMPRILDLLTDIFLNSVFDETNIDRERQVILQEICMTEDTPDEHVHDLFNQNFWPGAALGRSILGSIETVSSLGRQDIRRYQDRYYLPGRIVVAAAGDLEHQAFVDLISPAFSALPHSSNHHVRRPPRSQNGLSITSKDLEQVHLCLGASFPTALDKERYAAAVFSTLLGGNMSSRLFQEVREKRGLAYAVYSFLSSYVDAGLLGVYAGVATEHVNETIDLILAEIRKLCSEPVTETELAAAKEHLKGSVVLSLESTDNIMTRLAKNEITYERYVGLDEILRAIDAVTAEDLRRLAEAYLHRDSLALTLLGPVHDREPVAARLSL
jgi:predicted Zn-dependent peptidase